MFIRQAEQKRELLTRHIETDFVVIGGGMAGCCAAIAAAREGLEVVLLQDRPVPGGNASSEVRLWCLGATAHMDNNNRWAREGGVINEIITENMHRNPEGNPLLFDTVLLDFINREPTLTLLLNTSVFALEKNPQGNISSVAAWCSQNQTMFEVEAPLFCDASGDGIVAYLAGASYRVGAEDIEEFNEPAAPDHDFGELLGHTIYFYSKQTDQPVQFVCPDFAEKGITDQLHVSRINRLGNGRVHGCKLWWFEYGGRTDTIGESEAIKWQLWKIVYGVWDFIKNSGKYPEAENMTLEWVGHIPGKRESRRFEGDYMLQQADLIEQRTHPDAVAYTGWSIDLHPADGVYSDRPPCTQWHAAGVAQIPYRCLYSKDIDNLFLAGRIISASHVAFGSTRVMMTCAHAAQAVGIAAAICQAESLTPRELLRGEPCRQLQERLIDTGQHIPQLSIAPRNPIMDGLTIIPGSTHEIAELAPGKDDLVLDQPTALLVPAKSGQFPAVTMYFSCDVATDITVELRCSTKQENHTPDQILAQQSLQLTPGKRVPHTIDFDIQLDDERYVMICVAANQQATLALSDERPCGILQLFQSRTQTPPDHIGVETIEFWTPKRRPDGKCMAIKFSDPLTPYNVENLLTHPERPTCRTNAWVASPDDPDPTLTLQWDRAVSLHFLTLCCDADYDHPMESTQWGHPESDMPMCIREWAVFDHDIELARVKNNYQARSTVKLDIIDCSKLTIKLKSPEGGYSPVLFRIIGSARQVLR